MRIVHFNGAESGSPESAEWHAWRAAGIGASDAAIIAYNGGLLSPADAQAWQKDYAGLLAEKRGEATKDKAGNSFAAKRGKAMEATVAAMVSEQTGIPFVPAFGEMEEHPVIRSSFDGITFDLECINEIKVASKKVHEAAMENIVIPYYRPQLAHQALTAWGPPEGWGSDRCQFFANYNDSFEEKLAIVEISSSTEWLKRLAEALLPLHLAFWEEVQEGRRIPPEMAEKIARYRALRAQADALEKEMVPIKEDLIGYVNQLGVPKFEAGGLMVLRSERRGTIDYEAFLKSINVEKESLEAFRKAGSTSWTVKLV